MIDSEQRTTRIVAPQRISATHPAPVIMVGIIKFIKIVLAFVLIPLVAAFCLQAYFSITGNVAWEELTWMLIGLTGYFIAYIVIYGNNLRFIETLEHELNHAITAILTLRTIDLFQVVGKKASDRPEDRNNIYYDGKAGYTTAGNFLITLAPYFLPILTIPLLLVHYFTPDTLLPAVDILIGLTMGFHYAALAREFHRGQTDLQKQTLPFSVVITLLFNVIILVLVISVVVDNFRLTFDYLRDAFVRSFDYYSFIAAWIAQMGILTRLQEVVTLLSS